jgi:hypothetical protein
VKDTILQFQKKRKQKEAQCGHNHDFKILVKYVKVSG